MPAIRKQRTETLVGLFIFVGLVLFSWLVIQFSNFKGSFDQTYQVQVRFQDAGGIIKGTPVKLAGAHIGKVSKVPNLEDGWPALVRVTIEIDAQRKLPENSVFQIKSASVLGDKFIVVTIPEQPSAQLLTHGATLTGGGASGLEQIQNDAVQLAGEAKTLMHEARNSLSNFNRSLNDISLLAHELTGTVQRLNEEVLSPENTTSLRNTLANIEHVSADAQKTIQHLNTQLSSVGPALQDVPTTMQSIKRVANKAEGAVETAAVTFTKANKTLDTINSSSGLLNIMTRDEEVSTDTKTFVKNLRRHGILGYRDEETDDKDPRERFKGRRR